MTAALAASSTELARIAVVPAALLGLVLVLLGLALTGRVKAPVVLAAGRLVALSLIAYALYIPKSA